MAAPKYIEIKDTKIIRNRAVYSEIACSPELDKYFGSKLFSIEFDTDIKDASQESVQIPVVIPIVLLGWITGIDVFLHKIDDVLYKSLKRIKKTLQAMYPHLPISGTIHADITKSHQILHPGTGLLFSGGVDSTATLFQHRQQNPLLLMIRGIDIPLKKAKLWKKVEQQYREYARKEELDIQFISTNLRDFLNEKRLSSDFGKYIENDSWWGKLFHGLGTLGVCAPLTDVKKIGTLLMASNRNSTFYTNASHPSLIQHVSWAGLQAKPAGHEMTRQEMIRDVIKNHILKSETHPLLRVCFSQYRRYNCRSCSKCIRTITGLVLENIDPNKCGFRIGRYFFPLLKKLFLTSKEVLVVRSAAYYGWRDIKKNIPLLPQHNLHNSRHFFQWLRTHEISSSSLESAKKRQKGLLRIYFILPRPVQTLLRKWKTVIWALLSR